MDTMSILLITICFMCSTTPIRACTGLKNTVSIKLLIELQGTETCHSSVTSLSEYGIDIALAAQYVLDEVNSNRTELSVPGIIYNMDLVSTCRNTSYVARQVLSSLPESLWTEEAFCSSIKPSDAESSPLLGFIGPGYSSNVRVAASLLNKTNIPLITPSATPAGFSDNPNYNTLFSTAVSDTVQAKAIAELAAELNWTYVLPIYVNDDYGRQGIDSVIAEGKKRGICFAEKLALEIDADHRAIASKMFYSEAQAIIYFGTASQGESLIKEYIQIKDGHQREKFILASGSFGEYGGLLTASSLEGSSLKIGVITFYNNLTSLKGFKDYKTEKLNSAISNNSVLDTLLKKFYASCQKPCSFSNFINNTIDQIDTSTNTMKAMMALLWSFKQTHRQLCHGNPGICEGMNSSPVFYSKMLENIKSANFSTKLGDQQLSVKINDHAEEQKQLSIPTYKLSILQNGHRAKYVEIGYYIPKEGWKFTNLSAIKNISGSHCKSNCSLCFISVAKYVYIRNDSPYIIIGTGPITDAKDVHSCSSNVNTNGFVLMEAFYFAVEQIKERTKIDFSTLYINSCYAPMNMQMILNGIFNTNSTVHLVQTNGTAEDVPTTRIVAVIGDQASGISLILQPYLDLYKIPQISYASTTTWLSNRLRYPLFLRNVPDDEKQALHIVKIVQKLGLKQAGIIYQTDSAYAQSLGSLIIDYSQKNELCLTYIQEMTLDNINEIVVNLSQTADKSKLPRAIILVADHPVIERLVEKIKVIDKQWLERGNSFIATDSWDFTKSSSAGLEEFLYGSLYFTHSDKLFSWTVGTTNYFEKYLERQTPENNKGNSYFSLFWQQHFGCYLKNEFSSPSNTLCDASCKLTKSSCESKEHLPLEYVYSKNVVMAALGIAYAINMNVEGSDISRLFDTKDGRARFFRSLKSPDIPRNINSSTAELFRFQNDGDGNDNYVVKNVRKFQGKLEDEEVYLIENGIIKELNNPYFYKHGNEEVSVSDFCSTCQCLRGTLLPTSQQTKQQDLMNEKVSMSILIVTILVLVIITMLMLAAVLAILLRQKSKSWIQPDEKICILKKLPSPSHSKEQPVYELPEDMGSRKPLDFQSSKESDQNGKIMPRDPATLSVGKAVGDINTGYTLNFEFDQFSKYSTFYF